VDHADGRLLYLVLLALFLIWLMRGSGLRLGPAIRILAIWGVILVGLALAYTLVTGGE
jgi:hypothetical protein